MPSSRFHILNAGEARFECTFGRGCNGTCCQNGRPPVTDRDVSQIDSILPRALSLLRPLAHKLVKRNGYHTRSIKGDHRRLRIAGGWCVFFNEGCVLHRIGEAMGSKFAYKPLLCSLFPLEMNRDRQWYIRQKGYAGEIWDLSCLTPTDNSPQAIKTLQDEIAFASRLRIK